ncbi:MAG: VOC family protein [Desulfuromonadales bacterium]|nr:VOC family protein [Desulfuromonadales bacterium]
MGNPPLFKGVYQVGLVVKDCMASVRKYADEYGIGPWGIYEMNPATVGEMTIRGRAEEYAFRAAIAQIGAVMIELIEPLDDKSIYAEFLREHGEGIHHVLFDVEDYDKTVNFFAGKGIGIFQGGDNQGLRYAYFDTTKELGLLAEIIGVPAGASIPAPHDVYPKGD